MVAFCCLNGQKLTVLARNFNFVEINVSDPTFFLIYGYVEGVMSLVDFSWTDPLNKGFLYLIAINITNTIRQRKLKENNEKLILSNENHCILFAIMSQINRIQISQRVFWY